MLTTTQLSWHIKNHQILKQVCFKANTNKLHMIIGANGSGKTSLIKQLSASKKPTSGNVFLDQQPLHQYSQTTRAQRLSILEQQPTVSFDFDVATIVGFGRYSHPDNRSQRKQAIEQALEAVHAQSLKDKTLYQLSGGEQQRVHLARALTQIDFNQAKPHSRFLLLDEYAAHLDIVYQHQICTRLRQLLSKTLGIIATIHDLSLAVQYADDITLLKSGQVYYSGAKKDTLTIDNIANTFDVPRTNHVLRRQINHLLENIYD